MGREQAVVVGRGEDIAFGRGKMDAEKEGLGPADHKEDERCVAVEDPDLLVIDGRQPGPEPGLGPRAAEDRGRFFGCGRHSRVSKNAIKESISS